MNIPDIISAALLMGVVGSLHCVGMCGPLAFSLPVGHQNHWRRLGGGALYNLGRMTTYSVLGALFGAAGQYLLPPQWQSRLSVALGVLIFLYLLFPVQHKASAALTSWAGKPFVRLRQLLGRLFRSQKYSSLYAIGMLNGLLPCGLLYLALSSSLITGVAWKGSLFLFFFGAGTFPAMLAATFFGSYLNQQLRLRLRKAVPVFLFLMAALLVLRGLQLGIPYVSPQLPATATQEAVHCH